MSFIGLASLSLFKPDIWACVLGLRAYYFKPHKLHPPPPPPPPPQPLAKAGVGKGCIVSWIGCDFHVATRGWFDWGHVSVKCLVIMTTFSIFAPNLAIAFIAFRDILWKLLRIPLFLSP